MTYVINAGWILANAYFAMYPAIPGLRYGNMVMVILGAVIVGIDIERDLRGVK